MPADWTDEMSFGSASLCGNSVDGSNLFATMYDSLLFFSFVSFEWEIFSFVINMDFQYSIRH
jgi:hypothetical protein